MSGIHCRPGGEVHSGGGCSPSPVASESESDHFENSNTRPGAWLEGDDLVHRIERNSRPERAGGPCLIIPHSFLGPDLRWEQDLCTGC